MGWLRQRNDAKEAGGAPNRTATIDDLIKNRDHHRERLARARRHIGNGFPWYPYDILGNLTHVDALLHGANRDLGTLAAGLSVADVGAADGDLAFALEDQWGWQVDVVDTARTNMNGLRGARALREQLGSRITISDIDLDAQFRLPRDHYGLVCFLGILYHVQNPFFVLRELASRADHCLLSTRVARFAGEQPTRIAELPVAYLVNPDETNHDASNYWMFSPAGLDRIVARAGWSVLERLSAGDLVASDPSSPDHDERIFMLLRSS
jgi:hypothetical protein